MKQLRNNKKSILIFGVALVIAAISGWFITKHFFVSTERKEMPSQDIREGGKSEQSPAVTVKPDLLDLEDTYVLVKIFLPFKDGLSMEERRLKGNVLAIEMIEALVKEYLTGLKEQMAEVKLHGVYRDRSNTVYIDLSDEFRRNFSGDAKQEYYLLRSLFETVTKNVPETDDIRLLIEGREIESIGGHFYSLYGLKGIMN
ncbi:MAG: GerMN domain-containing protein [Thermodesulfovibrionales bacterium]|nr:GerMN domain-containing protein [Thermodesulfovibrionales bacterium]